MKIVKQYASFKEGKCSLVLITEDEVITMSGNYNEDVADFIENAAFYNDRYVIDSLHSLLQTKEYVAKQKVTELEQQKIQLEIEFSKIDLANLPEKVYDIVTELDGEDNWNLEGDNITYLRTNITMPALLMEAISRASNAVPFVKFWKRLCANPLESVKVTLFDWIVSHGLKISEHGLIVGYRGAVKLEDSNNLPINEVFWKCKNAKKGLSTHGMVVKDGVYTYRKLGSELPEGYEWVSDKSLLELIDTHTDNLYTHWYNRGDEGLTFSLNEVYRDDKKASTNSNNDCDAGLHFGNLIFGVQNFGNTLLGVLVCPSKIASVPYSDTNKARATEIYPFIEFTSEKSMKEFHSCNSVIETEIDYLCELDVEMEERLNEINSVRIELKYDGESTKMLTDIQLLENQINALTQKEFDIQLDVIRQIIKERNY